MEILRNKNNVPLGFLTNVNYDEEHTAEVSDTTNNVTYSVEDIVVVQGDGSKSEIILPDIFNKYDLDGSVIMYNSSGNVVFQSFFASVMPYCDISEVAAKLNLPADDVRQYEKIARYIIDSKTGGFKFVYKSIETIGMDTDYLLIGEKIHSLFKLYENAQLVYDVENPGTKPKYFLNKNKTAVIREPVFDEENRIHYKKVWKDRYASGEFREDFDYIVEGEFGYVVIPFDITEATGLLINDLACGNNRYLNKYMQSIKMDGFDFKYFDEALFGTGNLIVDNILQKYKYTINPRVM
jgi:hypothetical protein